MFFDIHHLTRYQYAAPVTLGHHVLRLKPADSGYQRLLKHELAIAPAPVVLTENVDVWGNRVFEAWFEGETTHLDIRATLAVETLRDNAFDYLAARGGIRLPPDYGDDRAALQAMLSPVADEAAVTDFIAPLLNEHANDPPAFLDALSARVHPYYRQGLRFEGAARTPAQTLERGEGVCRDLTVLFMAACRAAGIAARFVTGYQRGDGSRETRYLHAWPEVYLPGGGWRAYDPTHSAAVTDAHVALACAGAPSGAAPVTGSFGSAQAVAARLETEIHIITSE